MSCSQIELQNQSSSDTIYLMILDSTGTVLWNGHDHVGYNLAHSETKTYTIAALPGVPPPVDQTNVTFGCGVLGTGKTPSDKDTIVTYKTTSQNTAVGTYSASGTFKTTPPANFEVADLQDSYAKTNTAAVSKLLIAVANLIAPEVY